MTLYNSCKQKNTEKFFYQQKNTSQYNIISSQKIHEIQININIDSPIHSTITSKDSEKKRSVKNITKNNSNSNEQRIALNDTSEINNNK